MISPTLGQCQEKKLMPDTAWTGRSKRIAQRPMIDTNVKKRKRKKKEKVKTLLTTHTHEGFVDVDFVAFAYLAFLN